ncbi:MAG: RnfABCDGE type electron transport complex subunit D [Oscillospiraceae bacterium]|nr:RnfABCDGE type electron transport complex subunit D [Candidatus Limimonas egerieequi]
MNKVRSYMIDMLIMLAAAAVVAVYTYGVRALWSIVLSVIAAVATEAIGYIAFMKQNPTKIADLSAIFTGVAVALALPSSAPFWLAPAGAAFAIAVAKLPFGDTTTAPFVPAAVGIGFVTLSYPTIVFKYPSLAIGKLTASINGTNFVEGTSLAQMLTQSRSIGTNILNVLDVFVGRIPGPMGASCLILMIGTFFYLVIRKQSGAITTFSFILTCAIFAFLFPRVLTGRLYSVLMELGAGLLFYCAVFFMSDPATNPSTNLGKVLYGVTGGILAMILRRVGAYEDSVIFVVLIMNAICGVFDGFGETLTVLVKNKGKLPGREPRARRSKATPVLADGPEPEIVEESEAIEAPAPVEEPEITEEPVVETPLPVVSEVPEEPAPVISEGATFADLMTASAPVEEPVPVEEPTQTSDVLNMSVEDMLAEIKSNIENGNIPSEEGGNLDE